MYFQYSVHTVEQEIFATWKICKFGMQAILSHEIFENFWLAKVSKLTESLRFVEYSHAWNFRKSCKTFLHTKIYCSTVHGAAFVTLNAIAV